VVGAEVGRVRVEEVGVMSVAAGGTGFDATRQR